MKRVTTTTAAVGAAVAVFISLSLPRRQLSLPVAEQPSIAPSVAGVLHVHSNRSDGRSSPAVIAEAAARAGLQFIVLTDHGDATRVPDPPAYHSGVLCLDGVEISTSEGHYVAIGLPAAPYRLGGDARGVVEDVKRLGGFGVVAHPDSPKRELQWTEWSSPFDGMEILNLDTSWRLHAMTGSWRQRFALLPAMAAYPFRSGETIASLARSSNEVVDRWAALTAKRRVVALAGTDAHARVALRDVDPGDNRFTLPFPGYESAFRAVSVNVTLDHPLTGEPNADARALLGGLRAGHVFSASNGVATPPRFEFTATNAGGTAQQGDELVVSGPVRLRVRSNAPPTFTTTIWDGGRMLRASPAVPELAVDMPQGPAVYRVEIHASDREHSPVWLFSNPIYVRAPGQLTNATPVEEPNAAPAATRVIFDGQDASIWRVEKGSGASAAMRVADGQLELHYDESSATTPGGVAALLAVVPGFLGPWNEVSFTARADRPTRISVQLRTHIDEKPEERWQRSIYVDATARQYRIRFDEFTPLGPTPSATPDPATIPYVLFVASPGGLGAQPEGRLWLSSVVLGR